MCDYLWQHLLEGQRFIFKQMIKHRGRRDYLSGKLPFSPFTTRKQSLLFLYQPALHIRVVLKQIWMTLQHLLHIVKIDMEILQFLQKVRMKHFPLDAQIVSFFYWHVWKCLNITQTLLFYTHVQHITNSLKEIQEIINKLQFWNSKPAIKYISQYYPKVKASIKNLFSKLILTQIDEHLRGTRKHFLQIIHFLSDLRFLQFLLVKQFHKQLTHSVKRVRTFLQIQIQSCELTL